MMSEICITSSSAATRGMHVLAGRGRGRDDGVVAAGERDDQRRQRLGEVVARRAARRRAAPSRRRRAWRRRRRRPGALAGDQHMDVAAERLGGGQRLVGGVLERGVVVFGKQQRGHQSTPASFLSLATSSATMPTLMPALRPGGSVVLSTFRRGVISTPKSAGVFVVERLLLRLHDVGQRGVARLVQAQIGGDDRRQLQRRRSAGRHRPRG